MKTAIFYFSGTGNTKRVVNTWLEALENEGISAEAFRIEEGRIPELEPFDRIGKGQISEWGSFDRIGIFYPIHAFNAPRIVLDFAEKLPIFRSDKEVYLVMVSGEPLRLNYSSDRKLRRILKRKNAKVESAWHYIMPYNLVFRHTEEQAWKMDDTMRKLVPLDVKEYFTEGKCHTLARIPGIGWLTAALRIEQWFSGRNGKRYHVTGDCNQCGECVRKCPVGNIHLTDRKIRFGDRCILCARCSFFCPNDAIRIGLLDSWRVNGPYRFRKPADPEVNAHEHFCARAYERYYREAQERLK